MAWRQSRRRYQRGTGDRGGDRLGKFRPETVAEALAEPLDGFLDSLFGQVQPVGNLGQGERVLLAPYVVLQQFKKRTATDGSVFSIEACQGILDLLQRP